jgi:hypothetical protein
VKCYNGIFHKLVDFFVTLRNTNYMCGIRHDLLLLELVGVEDLEVAGAIVGGEPVWRRQGWRTPPGLR